MKEQSHRSWFTGVNHSDKPIIGETLVNGGHIVATNPQFAAELAKVLGDISIVEVVQPTADPVIKDVD